MKQIYLDYAATTPCAKEVLSVMMPYFHEKFGNPNSLHSFGVDANKALEHARGQVATALETMPEEIVFTSGATEATNIILRRVMRKSKDKKHIITTKAEHKSVLDACDELTADGYDVTLLDVMQNGLLDLELLKQSIRDDTALVSIHHVNNETGVLQDIKAISEICKTKGVLLHTDSTQAFGKMAFNPTDLGIDFLSASGHKIYGPKGVGIIFFRKSLKNYLSVRGASPSVEFGLRSGTVPVPLCIGFGAAAEIASKEISKNWKHISKLRRQFIDGFVDLPEIYINGCEESNYPGIVNISFRGVEGEALMQESSRIAISSGSACTSDKLSISHVLDAMKVPTDIAQSSVRVSIGKNTSTDDINVAIEDLKNATIKLRSMSPIWDMTTSGIDLDTIFKER